jgi:hypothetical protein
MKLMCNDTTGSFNNTSSGQVGARFEHLLAYLLNVMDLLDRNCTKVNLDGNG